MKLIIIANRKRTGNWVGELVQRMERRFGTQNVALEQVDGPDLPSATRLLLAFEKIVFRLRADGLGAPMTEQARAERRFTGEADLAIDVSGGAPALHPGARQTLAVLLNGMAGEEQLYAALLDGQIPRIDVVDADTGTVLASGKPAIDNGETVAQSADDVYARILTVIEKAVDDPASRSPEESSAVARQTVSSSAPLRFADWRKPRHDGSTGCAAMLRTGASAIASCRAGECSSAVTLAASPGR